LALPLEDIKNWTAAKDAELKQALNDSQYKTYMTKKMSLKRN